MEGVLLECIDALRWTTGCHPADPMATWKGTVGSRRHRSSMECQNIAVAESRVPV